MPAATLRRWFRIGGVVLVAVVLPKLAFHAGWEEREVKERKAALGAVLQLAKLGACQVIPSDHDTPPSIMRRVFGDRAFKEIKIVAPPNAIAPEVIQRLRTAFPEATISEVAPAVP